MTRWDPTATLDEDSYFEDLVLAIISSESKPLPPIEQQFGDVAVRWEDVGRRCAFVQSLGGTSDDRGLLETVVMEQLKPFGYRRAAWEIEDVMRKTADWNDVMTKAKRLIQSGSVRILRNGYDKIVAKVNGDHGTYQPEISRQDPNSRAITGSNCDCGWGEFQNTPRTREFKQYQDRVCSHILAAFWQSMSTPIDEDADPGNQPDQQSLFTGTPGGTGANPASGIMQQMQGLQSPSGLATPPQGQQMQMDMGGAPGGAQGSPGAAPADILPQFPMANQPAPANPASIPGLKGPTPTDPVAMPAGPGGAFSSVSWRFGGGFNGEIDIPPSPLGETTTPYNNGDLVQLRYPDTGTLVGRSEQHGAGQPFDLTPGMVGEVLGTHPSTGMVNVLYMGAPFDKNKAMEPFGATAWHFPSYLAPSANRPPGPAIRRTRP
jgi:hypothetical protein